MREIIRYEAFDGVVFNTQEECEYYEKNHIFNDESRIIFYSFNNKKIKNPCEFVFIDSNRFQVFDEQALIAYQLYCDNLKIARPKSGKYATFPLHYVYENNQWVCLEERIAMDRLTISTGYRDDYEENEEDRHNLAVPCEVTYDEV